MSDYHSRKALRSERYARFHGVKMIVCVACNGSGVYDHNGTPPCGSCGGSGRERAPLNRLASDPVPVVYDWRAKLKRREQVRVLKKQIHAAR